MFDLAKINLSSSFPRLSANLLDFEKAGKWLSDFSWYTDLIEKQKRKTDKFIQHSPIFVSPIKQVYEYKMYECPRHGKELLYEEFEPFKHKCPVDDEIYSGSKYDSAWSGWYNRRLADYLFWCGILYNFFHDEKYAEAGKEILMKFADLYLEYPVENTILGPAHVFFGTLSESFWGVYMAYGYDLLYNYGGFSENDHKILKEKLFYPLAHITQKFPESASNRQLWYNNVSAAIGFIYHDMDLLKFAFNGKYGFEWQLGSALPESGFWAEGPGYHFVTLNAMIHLAEMSKRNGIDLYNYKIAGRSLKKMFDAPFELILPNYEFPRIKDSGGGSILEYAPYYEIGYAVYKDELYLKLLNKTSLNRGKQVVGEESGKGEKDQPVSIFNLEPSLPELEGSIYPDGCSNLKGNGLSILRLEDNNDKKYLYLDYGILGGEHGHPDRLSIGYYALEKNWLVDPLNESYFNPNLQTWFRQTIAHNSVIIDETSQAWANGYLKFYGDLKGFQISSGYSDKIYPGTSIIRTIIQAGNYFLDILDVNSEDNHIIDLPYHSFGKLKISGVDLKKEPLDLFGHRPGIPGYDQLMEIYSGVTNNEWSCEFQTEDNKTLNIKSLGEKETEVFSAITPPVGGFYKQMLSDQSLMPMVMIRRKMNKTRFTNLIQAYEGKSDIIEFVKQKDENIFIIKKDRYKDTIYVDIENNKYWMMRSREEYIQFLNGFNISNVAIGKTKYFYSIPELTYFECQYSQNLLRINTDENFNLIWIYAPYIEYVKINGKAVSFERHREYIEIIQNKKPAIEIINKENLLFIGHKNNLEFSIWNNTGKEINENLKMETSNDFEENMKSQVEWWGGIVNLLPLNKGKIEKIVFPEKIGITESDLLCENQAVSVLNEASRKAVLQIKIPNDTPEITSNLYFKFSNNQIEREYKIIKPIESDILIPNNIRSCIRVRLKNNTEDNQKVNFKIKKDKIWDLKNYDYEDISIEPKMMHQFDIPFKSIKQYSREQLYPLTYEIKCGGFKRIIEHKFFIAYAKKARSIPSLKGDWKNWDTENPVLIDKPDQVHKLLMGNQIWKGPQDLSAKIYIMYDQIYLYIGAEVTDDIVITHFDYPRMSYPWDTDSMEIILDTRNGNDQGFDPPTQGLFRHLCLPEYRKTDFTPEKWIGLGAGGPVIPKPNLISESETFFTQTSKGYNIKCLIPLQYLENIIPNSGYKVGFDLAINDNDGTTYRKNQHIWAGYTQNQSWWDLSSIGALIFE